MGQDDSYCLPILVPKSTVTHTRDGMGSQKGFAALSSEPQVHAEAWGDFRVIGFYANSLGSFGRTALGRLVI